MNSIVIYATHFGNTRAVAEAIAGVLRTRGTAQLLAAEEMPAALPAGTDLVVIGGPTEGHSMTPPMAQLLDRMAPSTLRGVAAAAFDTRVRWPSWLSGSAGAGIADKLRRAGAHVLTPTESFFVHGRVDATHGKGPSLEPGELERAAAWAAALANTAEEANAGATPGRAI